MACSHQNPAGNSILLAKPAATNERWSQVCTWTSMPVAKRVFPSVEAATAMTSALCWLNACRSVPCWLSQSCTLPVLSPLTIVPSGNTRTDQMQRSAPDPLPARPGTHALQMFTEQGCQGVQELRLNPASLGVTSATVKVMIAMVQQLDCCSCIPSRCVAGTNLL